MKNNLVFSMLLSILVDEISASIPKETEKGL